MHILVLMAIMVVHYEGIYGFWLNASNLKIEYRHMYALYNAAIKRENLVGKNCMRLIKCDENCD